MKKLISMTDFVLEQNEIKAKFRYKSKQTADRILNYAKFLKQPLELWMFISCDSDGNTLEEPERIHFSTDFDYKAELSVYDEAKGRCLFKGGYIVRDSYYETKRTFVYVDNFRVYLKMEFYNGEIEIDLRVGKNSDHYKTIEDLIKLDFELTKTAQKQIEP